MRRSHWAWGNWAPSSLCHRRSGWNCARSTSRDADEIERGIAAFARDPHGGLILTVGPAALRHREMIIGLAARHKLPAVYPYRFFATEGGLVSYGPDPIDPYRRAAGYVDRILKGEKPADLPVQAPTKYELVINLKTAKALGLDSAADAARPRRRGDRMKTARVHHAARRRGGAWPLAARAQQAERMRRIGVLLTRRPRTIRKCRPASRHFCKAAAIGLDRSAATCGSTTAGPRAMPPTFANTRRNWSRSRRTSSWPLAPRPWRPLLQATRTVPIVFVIVADPVGAGFVDSLARPGGNATGFMQFEYSMSGKWLELLKQIAPGVTRAAVLRDPAIAAGIGQFAAIQAVAPSLGVEVEPGQRARRRRDRARRRGLRALPEWRPDRDGERVGARSSRSDHRACGPAQAARGLLRPHASSPPAA